MGNIVKVESTGQLSKTLLSWYESNGAPLSSYDTSYAYSYNDYMREMKIRDSFVHVRTAFGAGTFEQSLREAGYTLVADTIDYTGVSGCYLIHPIKKWYIRIELKSLPRDFFVRD